MRKIRRQRLSNPENLPKRRNECRLQGSARKRSEDDVTKRWNFSSGYLDGIVKYMQKQVGPSAKGNKEIRTDTRVTTS